MNNEKKYWNDYKYLNYDMKMEFDIPKNIEYMQKLNRKFPD